MNLKYCYKLIKIRNGVIQSKKECEKQFEKLKQQLSQKMCLNQNKQVYLFSKGGFLFGQNSEIPPYETTLVLSFN